MCIVCQAHSLDHAIELITDDIGLLGFAAVAAPPVDGRPRRVYTIGLEREYDHPELLVVGCDTNDALAELRHAAYAVVDGRCLFPGTTFEGIPIVQATPAQHQHPLLPMREAYDASIGHRVRPWPPLQLLVPDLACEHHPLETWRIDRDLPLLAGPSRPSRAERRRAARHRPNGR